MRNENKKYYKSYARLQRHIDKMMIIKVAADATVAIIITKFLSSSSDEFRLNLLSEFALAAIVEGVVVSAVAIGFVVFIAVTMAVVVVVTDVPGPGVVDTNRRIGS